MAVVPLMLAGLVVPGCAGYGKFGVYGGRGCLLGVPDGWCRRGSGGSTLEGRRKRGG
eukprot:SAG22_NODE_10975_length_506_cov_4.737101_1_plen_56_part_01